MDVTDSLQALQPASRIVNDSLDGIDKATPFEGRDAGVSLLDTLYQMHPSMIQAFVVDNQTAGLVAQQLHHVVRRVHEHKHVAAI